MASSPTQTEAPTPAPAQERPRGRIRRVLAGDSGPIGRLYLISDAMHQRRVLPGAIGLAISAAVALLVVLAEVNAQSRRIISKDGLAWSFDVLFGPGLLDNRQKLGWSTLATDSSMTAESAHNLSTLLAVHLALDFLFIAVYTTLVLLILPRVCCRRWAVVPLVVLGVLVLSDILEDTLSSIIVGGARRTETAQAVAMVLPYVSKVKWVSTALVALALIIGAVLTWRSRRSSGHSSAGVGKAVLLHRLSFLPAAVFLVLTVARGAPLLEQLPDAQRRWLDDAVGLRELAWAVFAFLFAVSLVYVTARNRSAFAVERSNLDDQGFKPPEILQILCWLIVPVLVLAMAAIAMDSGQVKVDKGPGGLLWLRLLIFAGVPFLVVVAPELIIRRRRARSSTQPGPALGPVYEDGDLSTIKTTGIIAVAVTVVVAGLGLLRSFVPLLLVGSLGTGLTIEPLAAVLIALGVVLVVVPWIAMMIWPVPGTIEPSPKVTQGSLERQGIRLLVVCSVVFLVLACAPSFAGWIGLAATAQLAIGSLVGIVTALGIMIQGWAPAGIFRGLKRTPVVSFLVVLIAIANLFSGSDAVHQMNRGADVTEASLPSARITLDEAFQEWLKLPPEKACTIQVNDTPVRPMLFIAAEGGGIRAAYWTVSALQKIAQQSCAKSGYLAYATLFSGGASGGSVGLTVARFTEPVPNDDKNALRMKKAVDAVSQMSSSGALAQGADGMFIRDLFYGATGVPLPQDNTEAGWTWIDRTRLIENAWAEPKPDSPQDWAGKSFLSADDKSPVPGHLILNSSTVRNQCRVWLSELQLTPAPETTEDKATSKPEKDEVTSNPEKNCDLAPGPAARTIDLFAAYGQPAAGNQGDHSSCLKDVSAVTAAMATARFPYVTAGGVIGPCPKPADDVTQATPYWPTTQLVDGGYLENSGLGTIVDLAPRWLPLIREHNRKVIEHNREAIGKKPSKEPLIVPFVVYLKNGELDASRPKLNQGPVGEFAVPPVTFLGSGTALSSDKAHLERILALTSPSSYCPVKGACDGVATHLPSRVILVDRQPYPEVSAPLGWTLSDATRLTLTNAMEKQATARCRPSGPSPSGCSLGYAPLGDLLNLAAAKDPAPPSAHLADRQRVSLTVHFGSDDASLSNSARRQIRAAVRQTSNYSRRSVRVVAHTDDAGTRRHGMNLSARRASAVEDELRRASAGKLKIRTHAVGEDYPVASNSTEKGKSQNRRVTITVEGWA